MYIVLEGLDKVGKTSLANHINKMLSLEIVKFSQPKREPYIEYMEFLTNRTEPAILDRFYLGEMAYGPVKRGISGLNEWQLRNIEMLLMMRNPLCIYAYTNGIEIKKNFLKEKEEYTKQDEVQKIHSHYMIAIKNSKLEWIEYNYLEDPNYERIDAIILNWYKNILYNLSHLQSLIPLRTLGNYYAKTLIVGEISNIDLEQDKYKNINVGFANGPSAKVLYEALPTKVDYALTNIKKVHNRDCSINEELLLPNLKRIICLGNNASIALLETNARKLHYLDIQKVYHPSFIARGSFPQEKYNEILNKLIL